MIKDTKGKASFSCFFCYKVILLCLDVCEKSRRCISRLFYPSRSSHLCRREQATDACLALWYPSNLSTPGRHLTRDKALLDFPYTTTGIKTPWCWRRFVSCRFVNRKGLSDTVTLTRRLPTVAGHSSVLTIALSALISDGADQPPWLRLGCGRLCFPQTRDWTEGNYSVLSDHPQPDLVPIVPCPT